MWKTLKCLTSSLSSTPRREIQGPGALPSRSALHPRDPVVLCDQPTTPTWDTEPGIDQDRAKRNSAHRFKADDALLGFLAALMPLVLTIIRRST